MTGFMHIGFGIVLTTLTNVYSSIFITGEIPFLGGVSVRSMGVGGCLPAPPLPLEMGKLGGGALWVWGHGTECPPPLSRCSSSSQAACPLGQRRVPRSVR